MSLLQDSLAYQKIYRTLESSNFETAVASVEEGIKRVLKEPYVFMDWELSLLYSYGQDCRLYVLPTGYFGTQASFAITKGSPLVPVFNKMWVSSVFIYDKKLTGLLKLVSLSSSYKRDILFSNVTK